MAEERAWIRKPAVTERRREVTSRGHPSVATVAASAGRTLQQRLGNQGAQLFAAQVVARSSAPGGPLGGGSSAGPFSLSHPDDAHEREADRVADIVMRTTVRGSTSTLPSMPTVQRVCADCEEGISTRERTGQPVIAAQATHVHRLASTYGASQVSVPVAANIHDMQGGGAPLSAATRALFEPRFGADFSHVRVHTGGRADSTAKAISAKAFTAGSDIVFATGQYSPESHEGQHLLAHELTHVVQQDPGTRRLDSTLEHPPATTLRRDGKVDVQRFIAAGRHASIQRAGGTTAEKPAIPAAGGPNKVGFVREDGLNLRVAPDQHSKSLGQLKFGQRVHTVEDQNPQPSWLKIAVLGQTGYAFAPSIHFPPEKLIEKDPALRLIRVRHGLSFWALVKEMYGIEGNESTKDQNMNHFINAIRACNKAEAFTVKTDMLDDIGNVFISGRDAKNTYLKENYDLWIPSFGVAAKMDVGSGTIRGEITRLVKKIEQKIDDFKAACAMSVKYMPDAIARRAGEIASGLLQGLLEFAKDAVKILAISTAVGALIGALFGGVGAIPGAEFGFEIGLLILQVYGLYTLIEAVVGIAADLVGQLGTFIKLVWEANGEPKPLDLAARALAEAIGILVSAVLIAVVAYVLKKGGEAIGKTKFAQTVGQTRLAQWLKQRLELQTTKAVLSARVVIDYSKRLSSSGYAGTLQGKGFGVFEGRIPGIKDPVAIKVYPEGHPVFANDLAGAQAASRTGYGAKFYGEVPAGPGKRAFAMEKVPGSFPDAAAGASTAEIAEAAQAAASVTTRTVTDIRTYGQKLLDEGFYYKGEVQGLVDKSGRWRAIDFQPIRELPSKANAAEYAKAVNDHWSNIDREANMLEKLAQANARKP
jgi:hypothetical protein